MIILIATWVIQILLWAGLSQQVVLNFRLKSTEGLSDLMLVGYFYGFTVYSYYIFLLSFPLAYKIMGSLSFMTMLIMIVQRFVYRKQYKKDKKLLLFFSVSACMACLLLPYACLYPQLVGNAMGWVNVAIWGLLHLPQVFKNYIRKSVAGLSFGFICLYIIACVLELMVAVLIGLPMQTKVTIVRAIIIYMIFYMQFWKYGYAR